MAKVRKGRVAFVLVGLGAVVGLAVGLGQGDGASANDVESTAGAAESTSSDTESTASDTESTASDTESTASDTESTASDTEERAESADASSGAAPGSPAESGRAGLAASVWATRTEQLGELLDPFPWLTVHRVEALASGTLRLECSVAGSSLRDVARFRDALKHHPLSAGATVQSNAIQVAPHGTCSLHGDVSDVMVFVVDLVPERQAKQEPGSLLLVDRCSAVY